MMVYIVMYWHYEDSSPSAVFSSREKAEEYCNELNSKHRLASPFGIEELELDAVPAEAKR